MAKLGIEVIKAIGQELRVLHADIIAEGVPERFAAILRRPDEPAPPRQAAPPKDAPSAGEHVCRGVNGVGENYQCIKQILRCALRLLSAGRAAA